MNIARNLFKFVEGNSLKQRNTNKIMYNATVRSKSFHNAVLVMYNATVRSKSFHNAGLRKFCDAIAILITAAATLDSYEVFLCNYRPRVKQAGENLKLG